ncbi:MULTISPECIES: Crp/Fnr family transcriptional regulator [unclassified Clostridium]|jgi:CRP-like cAMP-binding protein|uniref:Crp/Fnr family transcriptional regulator n=1 Tax=unclassified Clostridium TaxID=2614128 RepID=UPI00110753E6|nr:MULTISPECIES: Crp/Fnr family transcriptional regulator [unclassified Clostridium]
MTLTELEAAVPALKEYTKNMPEDIRSRCTVRTHAAGSIIHQKNMELGYFGIVAKGENRVINEFENGNVYMIESNKAIDFIGEVTILAGMSRTSVTIEAVTDNVVAYISRKDAERWLASDMNILHLTARHTAFKLYRSSYNNGAKLFYPPSYLLLDYMVKYGRQSGMESSRPPKTITVLRTRQMLQEEIGVNVKTLNRTIRQLKEEGFFSLCKGKITFTREQYGMAMEWLEAAKDK